MLMKSVVDAFFLNFQTKRFLINILITENEIAFIPRGAAGAKQIPNLPIPFAINFSANSPHIE